jgi:hypothetical protein
MEEMRSFRATDLFSRLRRKQADKLEATYEAYDQHLKTRREDAYVEALGTPIPSSDMEWGSSSRYGKSIFEAHVMADGNFPQYWLFLELFVRVIQRGTRQPWRPSLHRSEELSTWLRTEAERWLTMSRQTDPTTTVSPQDRSDFRSWARAFKGSGEALPIYSEVFKAMVCAVRAWAGNAELSPRIAPDIYAMTAGEFSPLSRWGLQFSQMLGHAALKREITHVESRKICLLKLSCCSALAMDFGDVNHCSFWIEPDDLKRLDFSKCRAVIS